jgi:hypothetical protein
MKGEMKSFMASLKRLWGSILRGRRVERLASTISAYEHELRTRAASNNSLDAGFEPILKILASARAEVEHGHLEDGWKCLLTAQRLEILHLCGAELNATAAALGKEAEKLNGWRKAAVIEALKTTEGEALDPKRVFRAAGIRDEHYHNEAYKDGLRRDGALGLAVILIAVFLVLFWLGSSGHLAHVASTPSLPSGSNIEHWSTVLATVGVFGLLGAIVSAITDMPKTGAPARIPEMASSFRVMILRLFIGPASAIVLYFVIRSSLSALIIHFDKVDGYAILVISFAAGFSERLVMRVVQHIAGETPQST